MFLLLARAAGRQRALNCSARTVNDNGHPSYKREKAPHQTQQGTATFLMR